MQAISLTDKETQDLEESLVAMLVEVQQARVVRARSGRVTEIHVLADTSKIPKLVVRDVETIVVLRTGARIDRRIVSVVCFPNGEERHAEVESE